MEKRTSQRRSPSTVIQCDYTPNAGKRKGFPFYLFISVESLPLHFWRQAGGVKLTGMKFECSDIDNHVKRTQKPKWEGWRTEEEEEEKEDQAGMEGVAGATPELYRLTLNTLPSLRPSSLPPCLPRFLPITAICPGHWAHLIGCPATAGSSGLRTEKAAWHCKQHVCAHIRARLCVLLSCMFCVWGLLSCLFRGCVFLRLAVLIVITVAPWLNM